MNLIVPIAGASSRFPDMKPKWMLTHPRGNMMVVEAVKGLEFEDLELKGVEIGVVVVGEVEVRVVLLQ